MTSTRKCGWVGAVMAQVRVACIGGKSNRRIRPSHMLNCEYLQMWEGLAPMAVIQAMLLKK